NTVTMSGHYKFSQLTEKFSEQRQAEISQKTAQLKTTMDSTLEEKEKQLLAMSDNAIDTSDIPELDDTFWENAKVVKPTPKNAVSIPLDEDIIEWFKKQGKSYPTLINSVLRSYINTQQNQTH
ncbi:MAG: BrnA antitoxin family protein, partial [Crocosphaera sp.]